MKRKLFLYFTCSFLMFSPLLGGKECNLNMMQYYGFEGLQTPMNYDSLVPQLYINFCPGIKDSCCTRQDFYKIQRQWNQKQRDIKKHITQIFRAIQKITVM